MTTQQTAQPNAVKFGNEEEKAMNRQMESPRVKAVRSDLELWEKRVVKELASGKPLLNALDSTKAAKELKNSAQLVREASANALRAACQSLDRDITDEYADLVPVLAGTVLSAVGVHCLAESLCEFLGNNYKRDYYDVIADWWQNALLRISCDAFIGSANSDQKKGGAA